jgi:HPt (histidine-containing phosphotransfer) domain-containing protein
LSKIRCNQPADDLPAPNWRRSVNKKSVFLQFAIFMIMNIVVLWSVGLPVKDLTDETGAVDLSRVEKDETLAKIITCDGHVDTMNESCSLRNTPQEWLYGKAPGQATLFIPIKNLKPDMYVAYRGFYHPYTVFQFLDAAGTVIAESDLYKKNYNLIHENGYDLMFDLLLAEPIPPQTQMVRAFIHRMWQSEELEIHFTRHRQNYIFPSYKFMYSFFAICLVVTSIAYFFYRSSREDHYKFYILYALSVFLCYFFGTNLFFYLSLSGLSIPNALLLAGILNLMYFAVGMLFMALFAARMLQDAKINVKMTTTLMALWVTLIPFAFSVPKLFAVIIISYQIYGLYFIVRLVQHVRKEPQVLFILLPLLNFVLACIIAATPRYLLTMQYTGPIAAGYLMFSVCYLLVRDYQFNVVKLKEASLILQDINQNLEDIVRDKTRNIQIILEQIREGIIKFSESFLIEKESSQWAFEFFGVKPGDDVRDLLERIDQDKDAKALTLTTIFTAIGEPRENWEFNSESVIKSGMYKGRHLSLFWSPVIDKSDTVKEMILTVIDETEKMILAEAGKRADERVTRLLTKAKLIIKGGTIARKFVADIPALSRDIEKLHLADEANAACILRRIHTIKGGARTIGLTEVRDLAHNIEDEYKQNNISKIELLASDLLKELNEYRTAVQEVLGQEADEDLASTTFDIAQNLRTDIQKRLNENYISLKGFNIRDELGAVPLQIRQCLLHAVTNACDHGFIIPLQRGESVKDAIISIEAYREEASCIIKIKDNGAGINWKKLTEIAEARGFVPNSERTVSDLVFENGVSTAEEISKTSGRGIGMGVIKQAMNELGGSATLLDNDDEAGSMLLLKWPYRNELGRHKAARSA